MSRFTALVAIRIGVFAVLATAVGRPAELKKETLRDWNQYLRQEQKEVQKRTHYGENFLWTDSDPERSVEVRSGSIVVSPVGIKSPIRVASGLIHHWIGSVFVPNARAEDVLAVTRDYSRYKDYYKPSVVDSKTISSSENKDEYTICFGNTSVTSKTSLEGDYTSEYVRVDNAHWYSVSTTTQMREIKNLGKPGEERLSPDEGSGYIWRLYSTFRLEERDGGVVVEMEAIALSREVPGGLHWLVDPIVRRVSRDSIEKSLRETADAARAHAESRVEMIAQSSR